MKEVFCYYRKSVGIGNLSKPVQKITYQDKTLYEYCAFKRFYISKRFSDLGYLGSPFRRPELVQMKRLLEKPNYQPSLLVLYSIEAMKETVQVNEQLFSEIVKQIGEVYFYKEDVSMSIDTLQSTMKNPESRKVHYSKTKRII